MVSNFIQTVKKQIDHFDHVLNKNPDKLSIKAKIYPLKYAYFQLLEYLKQKESIQSIPVTKNNELSPNSIRKRHSKTESTKNLHAVKLGRLGGLKGGKARAKKLSPKERSDIARMAAKSRWSQYEKI